MNKTYTIMPNTKWSDLNRDGRRLEAIIKDMNTKYWKEPNIDIKFAYSDRLLKATHEKALIADRVLGVKKLLKGETVEYDEKLYLR